jgi:SRSO17 transposase
VGVAGWSGSLLGWGRELTGLKGRLASVFGRAEVRQSAGAFIDGALSGVARKTGWQLAEQAGLDRPYRMQSLLGRSGWDADALRNLVRDEVIACLGDRSGVLVVDETGFLKKGTHSVGVARQYSGTAGRVENCQVGVFLGYASRLGQALIDRRLYLPEAWSDDDARRSRVQIPESVTFATKPQIACALIAAALDAGVPCAWVLADALYGSDSRLRRTLEERRQPYVLAVRSVDAGFERWVLIRRSRHDPQAQAHYLVFAPAGTELAELAGAAGLRWTIEECFQRAKEELGLDHCEARSWHGWHRHMTLCLRPAVAEQPVWRGKQRRPCYSPVVRC